MEKRFHAPEVYQVFRLYTAIRLLVSLIPALAPVIISSTQVRPWSWVAVYDFAFNVILLVYLSWPWLIKKMSSYHFPLGLVITTLEPITLHLITLLNNGDPSPLRETLIAGQLQTILVLFVPLLLISWTYPYRIVIGYCFMLATVYFGFYFLFSNPAQVEIYRLITVNVLQTLFYLFVGYIIHRLVTGQRTLNTRLTEANQRLANHANTLEQLTISRERNRLAREFHDTVAHSLSAVAVQLEAVRSLWETSPEKARDMLDFSLDLTRSGLNETRRAIHSLRAGQLEDLGLLMALEHLANSIAGRDGLALDLSLPKTLPPLNNEVEHGIYRIAEEALRNASNHARAKTISVHLDHAENHLLLTIADDGLGFLVDQENVEDHFGIRGMYEYAEMIGGRLAINTRPGDGTSIRLELETFDD